jgi:hypothetical protein
MTSAAVMEAFRAEAERLSKMAVAEQESGFSRLSRCTPWTVGELLYHVRTAAGRLTSMFAEPEPGRGAEPGPGLVDAAAYYRRDHRYSPAANAERVAAAQRGAAGLASGAAIVREFDLAWRESWELARAAPPTRVVRTRHGDRMLLTEFLRTRVLELAVHGLDLAAGFGRAPWMTAQAADVVTALVLPGGYAAQLQAEAGWDLATLIAKATGRRPLTAAESALLQRRGIRLLALG